VNLDFFIASPNAFARARHGVANDGAQMSRHRGGARPLQQRKTRFDDHASRARSERRACHTCGNATSPEDRWRSAVASGECSRAGARNLL